MSSLVLAPQLKYLTSHLIIVMEEDTIRKLSFAKRNEMLGENNTSSHYLFVAGDLTQIHKVLRHSLLLITNA